MTVKRSIGVGRRQSNRSIEVMPRRQHAIKIKGKVTAASMGGGGAGAEAIAEEEEQAEEQEEEEEDSSVGGEGGRRGDSSSLNESPLGRMPFARRASLEGKVRVVGGMCGFESDPTIVCPAGQSGAIAPPPISPPART